MTDEERANKGWYPDSHIDPHEVTPEQAALSVRRSKGWRIIAVHESGEIHVMSPDGVKTRYTPAKRAEQSFTAIRAEQKERDARILLDLAARLDPILYPEGDRLLMQGIAAIRAQD